MSKNKDFLFYRAYIIYFSFVLLMILVLWMTLSIQLSDRNSLFGAGDDRIPKKTINEEAEYGDILDKDLNPLVTTISYYDIAMDPSVVDQKVFDTEISKLSEGLSEIFKDRTPREYENLIRSKRANSKEYVLLQKQVTNDQRKQLRKLPIFELGQMKGGLIDNQETSIRKKLRGFAGRTMGRYTNKDGKVTAIGIEGAFHDVLAGESGKRVVQKLATGWKKTDKYEKEAVSGSDLVLTIDSDIQEVVHSELEKQLIEMDASHGCVIVMEVKTGYVRAISNLKRHPDNTFTQPYNYAIGTRTAPGSTFKLASLMAALEDGKLHLDDIVNASGKYVFKGSSKPLYDSNWGNGYGEITVQEAFEKSSNVIAPTINDKYKNEPHKFIDRLKQFGITDPLGIKLMGEKTPLVSRPGTQVWSGLSIPYMAIGYEVEQVPLQTLSLYNTVANNGKMMKPLFVQEIRRSGKVVESFSPVVLKERICSQSTIDKVKKCLEGVMKTGTGSDLASVNFDIAGKTGTAKIMDESGQFLDRGQSDYQASFCGYFPAENPLYSCIVVIYKPKVNIYGAKVSGTVFAAVANKVFASNLQFHDAINEVGERSKKSPQIKSGYKSNVSSALSELGYEHEHHKSGNWINSSKSSSEIKLSNRKIDKKLMPNVKGMTAKDAVFLLESLGYVVKIKGFGQVVYQSVKEGEDVEKGRLVQLTLKE
ncbi:MAG: transpeptidase family protein [Flavobacteriales bacterium]|nr:transpeptidase family protein [Flavobacteriales bacterium]